MAKWQAPVGRVFPETRRRAMELVVEGKLIHAIKLVRKATGADLVSAKQYVDGLQLELLVQRVPPEVADQARALVAGGDPKAAGEHVRKAAGLSRSEGRQYVEALQTGVLPAEPPVVGDLGRPLSERVRSFTAAGDRPSAVALVRAETGLGPAEAERFVDALEQDGP
ncbi:hypothetical protein [Spirillospora albida]|uniref:hypothetical protein n=1 Tax=Spirillospora albida TaxID=58123 RepID=UPI0004C0D21D|nr:hypothetical protein [Spirillospora albida]